MGSTQCSPGFLDGQTFGMFDFDPNDVSTQSYEGAEWSRMIREGVLAHIKKADDVDTLAAEATSSTAAHSG